MQRALIAIPLALCTGFGAGLLPAAQDPDDKQSQDPPEEVVVDPDEVANEDEEIERDIFGRVRTKPRLPGEESNSMQGMWQLVAMELEGYPDEGLTPVGFLLIGEAFLAFELQAYYSDDVTDDDPWEDGYQTFMAEYEVISGQQLICTSLIGSYLDEEEDILDYEPPGIVREFTIERTGKLLTLRFGDDDWMTFGKREPTGSRLQDLYGRDRGTRTKLGPDIYGREKAKEELGAHGKKRDRKDD